METKRSVWLDCDPGHDDALAIILAGHSASIKLLGISTVAGNQSIDKVTDNALRVLSIASLQHVEVVQGQQKPLLRPPLHCPEIHGDSGLDGPSGGPVLPETSLKPTPGKAPIIMYERIKRAYEASDDGRVITIVATGALTNIAVLLILYPEVRDMIDIVLMGGALGLGNTGPVVEFNIQTDPESAHIVFESGIRVTMVPLEVTHSALCTSDIVARIRDHKNQQFTNIIVDLLMYFQATYKRVFKFDHPPLHDPCAVAFVICPEIFRVEHYRVDVETASSLTAGQTVVDVWLQSNKKPNVHVCMEMDVDRFWDIMIDAIHKAANLFF